MRCINCGWEGELERILRATSPFDERRILWGCPECLEAETVKILCDEPGCTMLAGYKWEGRWTCLEHKVEVMLR